jgi:hypothetical protein
VLFSVELTFEDGVATWGPDGGVLTIDNIRFADVSLGDVNCDTKVDGLDVYAFTLALTDPAGYALAYPECDINNADINGDSSVTIDDLGPFVSLLLGS